MKIIDPKNTKAKLGKFFDDLESKNSFVNIVMTVESRDGSFRWIGGSGGENCEETPFFIASIDKLLNAILIMKLHESQKLNIDDKILDNDKTCQQMQIRLAL